MLVIACGLYHIIHIAINVTEAISRSHFYINNKDKYILFLNYICAILSYDICILLYVISLTKTQTKCY